MKIFALRGKGDTGKSTTIRILHSILLDNGYSLVETNLPPVRGDFRSVFSKNNVLIGITSSGDTFDLVYDNLDYLIRFGCTICVCACRTYDRTYHGTNAAIDEFNNYEKEYIDKNFTERNASEAQQLLVNQNDAQRVFLSLNALVMGN